MFWHFPKHVTVTKCSLGQEWRGDSEKACRKEWHKLWEKEIWSWSDERMRLERGGRGRMHVPDKVSSLWEGREAIESKGTARNVGRWEGGQGETHRAGLGMVSEDMRLEKSRRVSLAMFRWLDWPWGQLKGSEEGDRVPVCVLEKPSGYWDENGRKEGEPPGRLRSNLGERWWWPHLEDRQRRR